MKGGGSSHVESVRVQAQDPKWRRLVFWLFAGGLIGMIFAASWAAESQMTELGWLPGWMGRIVG